MNYRASESNGESLLSDIAEVTEQREESQACLGFPESRRNSMKSTQPMMHN